MNFWDLKHHHKIEFCEQVLAILKKRNVTFRGARPDRLVLETDGAAKMWFYGHRRGMPWIGGVKVRGLDMTTNIALARPEMVAQIIEEQIDNSRARLDI